MDKCRELKGLTSCLNKLLYLAKNRHVIHTRFCSNTTAFKFVIVGGGSGGASVSNAIGRKFGRGKVAVVEPNPVHYYQPIWTLVGCGVKKIENYKKPSSKILKNATWINDSVASFDPQNDRLTLKSGKRIGYDVLVIAVGLQLRYELIKGLPEAFETPGLGSNYHSDYVHKTLESLRNFNSGNAIFTFPQTVIKCPGAPQKIMYLTEEYFRKVGKRDKATIIYCTPSNFMFGVKAYNGPLETICDKRGVKRLYKHALIEVKPDAREAVFEVKDADNKVVAVKSFKYEMLHVAPPCSAPEALRHNSLLADSTGFLDVDKFTLQHKRFNNIFGIGDCTNVPTSKTGAAVASESGVLQKNIISFCNRQQLSAQYDGYSSCPLVTGFSSAILPEFDYSLTPLETFPFDQSKESRMLYHLKADVMPVLYWHGLVKGIWTGPKMFRKIFHLNMGR